MRNKKLIIGIIVIAAFIGVTLIAKAMLSIGKGKKAAPAAQAKGALGKAPAMKVISKGRGALTIKVFNYKNAEIPIKIKLFKVANSRSSVYAASTVGGRKQELLPGTYDIEIDTVPQKIFKNIKVNEGKERLENLGCVTGALTIKTINAKKAPANYPLRILYSKTNDMVTALMTNKTIELVPGVYDVEIGTLPRLYRKDIRIEGGEETSVDLGCLTGTLLVKTVDENKKDVRCNVRITKTDTNEIISSAISNKPIELGKGRYNVEVMVSPKQSKNDITIDTGEEAVIEFTVTAPVIPQKPAAAAKRTASRSRPVTTAQPASAAAKR